MGKKNSGSATNKARVNPTATTAVAPTSTATSENMNQETDQQQQPTGAPAGEGTANEQGQAPAGAGSVAAEGADDGAASGGTGEASGGVDDAGSVSGDQTQSGDGGVLNNDALYTSPIYSIEQANAAFAGSSLSTEALAAMTVQQRDEVVEDFVKKTQQAGQMTDGTSSEGVSNGAITAITDPVQAAAPVRAETVNSVLEQAVADMRSANSKMILQNVQTYAVAMGPNKPMSDEEGARHQVKLYRAMVAMINNAGDEFDAVLTAFLRALHLGSVSGGVFNDVNAFRFTESLQLPEEQRKTFRHALHFFKLVADPKSRATSIRQVQFEKVFGSDIAPEGVERVKQYFNI